MQYDYDRLYDAFLLLFLLLSHLLRVNVTTKFYDINRNQPGQYVNVQIV